jgi:DNA repair protein RadC
MSATQIQQRPREKLRDVGKQNLTDAELLSLLLGSGSKQKPLAQLSRSILRKFSLTDLLHVNAQQLCQITGIGEAQASRLLACVELGKRLHSPTQLPTIMTSEDVCQQATSIARKTREHLMVLYLNARQELVAKEVVSIGGLNYTNIQPREVFSLAVSLPAMYLILVHNHPSGTVIPSQADLEVTERLVAAGQLLGISILDHMIVAWNEYYSFREKGLL